MSKIAKRLVGKSDNEKALSVLLGNKSRPQKLGGFFQ